MTGRFDGPNPRISSSPGRVFSMNLRTRRAARTAVGFKATASPKRVPSAPSKKKQRTQTLGSYFASSSRIPLLQRHIMAMSHAGFVRVVDLPRLPVRCSPSCGRFIKCTASLSWYVLSRSWRRSLASSCKRNFRRASAFSSAIRAVVSRSAASFLSRPAAASAGVATMTRCPPTRGAQSWQNTPAPGRLLQSCFNRKKPVVGHAMHLHWRYSTPSSRFPCSIGSASLGPSADRLGVSSFGGARMKNSALSADGRHSTQTAWATFEAFLLPGNQPGSPQRWHLQGRSRLFAHDGGSMAFVAARGACPTPARRWRGRGPAWGAAKPLVSQMRAALRRCAVSSAARRRRPGWGLCEANAPQKFDRYASGRRL
mmetsp:Transcript_6821/g.21506  ORF Transcript_6821/g.21506 Transcript_6821/m.21506 type:complete len:369 (-) Transcript_6821:29-1135(-)